MKACVLAVACSLASMGVVAAEEDHSKHRASDAHAQHQGESPTHSHAHSTHSTDISPSEAAHVPPDPPALVMDHMSKERMIELMQMDDDAAIGMLRIDQVEGFRHHGDTAMAWEGNAWFGTDYDKAWLKTEGERLDGETTGRAELLWDRIVSAWWSVQVGVRHDFLSGSPRTWGAIGVQGLAPYFIETTVTVYVADEGRAAARFTAERDLLLTQRLIVQPQFELDAFLEKDQENAIGSGIADVELGLRLRYEIVREFAPYLGVQWRRKLGGTADFARAASGDATDVAFVAGVRAWF